MVFYQLQHDQIIVFRYVRRLNYICFSPHSLFKSHYLPLKVKVHTEFLVSALILNAFLQKTETAIQGTLTGVYPPEEKNSSSFKPLKDISSACAGSISLMKN